MHCISRCVWRGWGHAGTGMACKLVTGLAAVALFCAPLGAVPQALNEKVAGTKVRFAISFSTELSAAPLDGRAYVIVATTREPEPRFQILEDEVKSQQIFGVDVDGLAPGQDTRHL